MNIAAPRAQMTPGAISMLRALVVDRSPARAEFQLVNGLAPFVEFSLAFSVHGEGRHTRLGLVSGTAGSDGVRPPAELQRALLAAADSCRFEDDLCVAEGDGATVPDFGRWLAAIRVSAGARTTRFVFMFDRPPSAAEQTTLRQVRDVVRDAGLFAATSERGVVRRRLLMAAGLVAVLLLFVPFHIPVIVEAEVVPQTQVEVTSPLDGAVASFPIRTGERVEAGQLLAAFDVTDLKNRRSVADQTREAAQMRADRSELLGVDTFKERAEVSILRAEVAVESAKVALSDFQISQARIVAPFEGVLIVPSEEQLVGRYFKVGDRLATLTSLDADRVFAFFGFDERFSFAAGQTAYFSPSSAPGETYRGRFLGYQPEPRMSPSGRNGYVGVFALDDHHLRSGQQGYLRIDGPSRSVVAHILHKSILYVQLALAR